MIFGIGTDILEIERDSYGYPWSEKIFLDCITHNYHCKVLMLDEVLVGYVITSLVQNECHIMNLCSLTLPSFKIALHVPQLPTLQSHGHSMPAFLAACSKLILPLTSNVSPVFEIVTLYTLFLSPNPNIVFSNI